MIEKKISSRSNKEFLFLKKIISSDKFRYEQKMYWIEGEKNIKTFCRVGNKNLIQKIIVTEETRYIIQEKFLSGINADILVLAKDLYDEISLISTCFKVGTLVTLEKLENIQVSPTPSNVIYLHNIQDPGNLGTILRTCSSFNFTQIWISKRSVDPWSPKVIRSSAGYHCLLKIVIFENFDDVFKMSCKYKLQTFLIDTNKEGSSLLTANLEGKNNLFLFGTEGKGFPVELKETYQFNDTLSIPQNSMVDSLNLAVAVSICLYESFRQNQ
mgnify:FL=1